MQNVTYKEDVKYDENKLDVLIKSKNLFNGIKGNKHDEIKNLIYEIKNNLINKINNKSNQLNKWSDEKYKLIQNDYLIILKKSNDNLNTNDTNQIINILVYEVKNIPRFFDPFKNEYQSSEIKEKLSYEAKNIANQYLANQNERNDIIKKITDDKNRIQNETNNTINELKAQINNLIEEKNKAQQPSPPRLIILQLLHIEIIQL